jgi:allantoate deiminase
MRAEAERIAAKREVELDWDARGETAAVPTSRGLRDRLAAAVKAAGRPVEQLPSGAGHDGVTMAALTPIAMLFVRCERGISHNPAEAVAEADVAIALDVLERFVSDLK